MSSAEATLNDPAQHLPEATDEESGLNVKADPADVAKFKARIENAHPKWKKLLEEAKRLYP
jgi:hypothetical protein